MSSPAQVNAVADTLAQAASYAMPDAALLIIADNEGHVAYRSKLSYADLNAVLRQIGEPLHEGYEVSE